MLDRPGNAHGDIDFRRHDLAGLPDLIVVRHITGVDRGAARTDRRAQLVRQREDGRLERLAVLQRATARNDHLGRRSEEHTSELQSLMRISYAVFCLKKKKQSTYKD